MGWRERCDEVEGRGVMRWREGGRRVGWWEIWLI